MAFLSSSQIAEITNPAKNRKIQIVTRLFLYVPIVGICLNQGDCIFFICTFVKETVSFSEIANHSHSLNYFNATRRMRSCLRLTEAHAAESLKDRQYDNPADVAFAFDAEYQDHEDQYQGRLTAHHHELRDHMREQDFARRHTSYPASVQQALHPLDNQCR